MKRSLLLPAIVVLTTILGCRENNATSVVDQDMKTAPIVEKGLLGENIIHVKWALDRDPMPYEVLGRVKYQLIQLPILKEEVYDVSLETEVDVSQGKQTWNVAGCSVDRVVLNGVNEEILDKYYFLRRGPLSIYLNLQFAVTATEVLLIGVDIIE
jgi:hypothetical protein